MKVTDMEHIPFFKQDTVDNLRKNISKNLPWYRNEDNAKLNPAFDECESGKMSISFDPICFDSLSQNTKEIDDKKNVLTIYEKFNGLSLQQASDERVWVYATHVLAKKYTSNRWAKISDDDDKAIKYIRAHYFGSGPRGLIRNNAVSRLWWMGRVASRCKDYDLEHTLDILLRNSDVRASLLERSSLSMSEEIFSGVIRLLGRSAKEHEKEKGNEKSTPPIYERKIFRNLMKNLNQKGGRIMLNALTKEQIDNLLTDMATKEIQVSAKD